MLIKQNEDENCDETAKFSPKFDDKGLITAVVTDWRSGALLMVAHMNEAALKLTLETKIAHYWSRSRQKLWKKGETSGNFQSIKEIFVDCDQDALWLKVEVMGDGVSCHTKRETCFYRQLISENGEAKLLK